LGQRIEAFVVLKPDRDASAQELTARVSEQLSPHKRPRAVHFLEELPRNAMGKVQKKQLQSR
jgi:acyl-coenzyme A synthetase/AMP-(fatty) acid ligase